MKAIVNGISVEGTPQEIMEYQRMQEVRATMKPPVIDRDWIERQSSITSSSKGECPNKGYPCNCTGACNGSLLSKMTESFNRLHEYTQKSENSRG